MKKPIKNEIDMLGLINKIQAQLTELDKKIDTLINRPSSSPGIKPYSPSAPRTDNRTMHKAICADCGKECTIPFKPSGDRPIYCQDCFSRRKVIKMSGMTVVDKPVVISKPFGKKKLAPKKK